MGLIQEALRDRREQRVRESKLKKEAIEKAKANMTFEARLQESLDSIANILKDGAVTKIVCTVEDKDLANITKAIYVGKLSEYKVSLEGNLISFEREIIEM